MAGSWRTANVVITPPSPSSRAARSTLQQNGYTDAPATMPCRSSSASIAAMRPVSLAITSSAGAFREGIEERRRRRSAGGFEIDRTRAGPPSVLRQPEGPLARRVQRHVLLGDRCGEFVDAGPGLRIFDRDHPPRLLVATARGEARDIEHAAQRLPGNGPIDEGPRRSCTPQCLFETELSGRGVYHRLVDVVHADIGGSVALHPVGMVVEQLTELWPFERAL